jgi:hypothetical protein
MGRGEGVVSDYAKLTTGSFTCTAQGQSCVIPLPRYQCSLTQLKVVAPRHLTRQCDAHRRHKTNGPSLVSRSLLLGRRHGEPPHHRPRCLDGLTDTRHVNQSLLLSSSGPPAFGDPVTCSIRFAALMVSLTPFGARGTISSDLATSLSLSPSVSCVYSDCLGFIAIV